MTTSTHLTVPLKPLAGDRFQPTGFPDLGAATFQAWSETKNDWIECLHVESPQSMANRLEATTWSGDSQVPALEGVPYLEVVDKDGILLTSSRLEAHRLASAYIREGSMDGQNMADWMAEHLGLTDKRRQSVPELASKVFDLDPLSLIHGVFFAIKSWPEQPKIARAVTAFIDARNVRAADSGGVKTDSVSAKGGDATSAGAEAGYGMVPHHRREFTAQAIEAQVIIDHQQIESYGLGPERSELLLALIDFELAHLLGDELRLRTACHLSRKGEISGGSISSPAEAEERVQTAIKACGDLPARRTVQWSARSKKA